MRLADCKPGLVVRFGKKDNLNQPTIDTDTGRFPHSGTAVVVAVGKFTLTSSGHCGEIQPAEISTGTNKVLVLRQAYRSSHRRWTNDHFEAVGPETTWHWDVVSPSMLMTLEEWDAKSFPLFEQWLEVTTWQKRYSAAKKRLATLAVTEVRSALGPLIPRKSKSGKPRDPNVNVYVEGKDPITVRFTVSFDLNEAQARKLVGSAHITEVLKLAKTRPNACYL